MIASCRSLARRPGLTNVAWRFQLTQDRHPTSITIRRPAIASYYSGWADRDEKDQQQQRHCLLQPIVLITTPITSPFLQQRFWHSTTAFANKNDTSRPGQPKESSVTPRQDSSLSDPDTTSSEHHKKSRMDQARHVADEIRANARHRAEEIRDHAAEHYREFKEHPRATTVASAKTFGAMMKLYGPVLVGTYLSIYGATLGMLFVGVESGALDPAVLFGWLGTTPQADTDSVKNTVQLVVEFLDQHALTKSWAPFVERNPSVANLAVAWIATKFTEPIRAVVTLGVTPRVARSLGWTVQPEDAVDNKDDNNTRGKEESPSSSPKP